MRFEKGQSSPKNNTDMPYGMRAGSFLHNNLKSLSRRLRHSIILASLMQRKLPRSMLDILDWGIAKISEASCCVRWRCLMISLTLETRQALTNISSASCAPQSAYTLPQFLDLNHCLLLLHALSPLLTVLWWYPYPAWLSECPSLTSSGSSTTHK